MVSSLEAILTLRAIDGSEREVPAVDFTLGPHQTALQPGELLVAITIPATILRRRAAFRRSTLTHMGRSTALLVGTASSADGAFTLTISAATPRPVQITAGHIPDTAALRASLHEAIPDDGWFDDVHGSPEYRKHMSHYLAEQIRAELAASA
jgi:CO/xanthine dehydrogenase FAD-binding subunit